MADDLEPLQTSAALDQHSEADDREDAGAQAGTNSNSDVKPELSAESWGQLGPLIPPDDGVEQVTADGGVLKKVLEPGLGDKPPLFSRCLVHYVGRLQSTGAVFIDTKTESAIQQPVRIVAGRHTSPKETGLFQAVATMRTGERAVVYVQDPKYGYGDQGSFSFPAVPPSERLTYEVECIDFEAPDDSEEPDTSNLLYEERLERAEQRRLLGNQLFGEGRFREALGKYAVALSYLDEDFMMQLEGFYEDKANEVKIPIHLNMAACQLRIKDYHTCIYNCTEVLKLQPGNVKAMFRRGTARHKLGQTEGALADLQAASEKAPEDRAIRAELAAVRQTIKEERAAEAKLFKGQFKFPDPKPGSSNQDGGSTPSAPPGPPDPTRSAERAAAAKAALQQLKSQAGAGGASSRGAVASVLGWLWALLLWLGSLMGLRKGVSQQPSPSISGPTAEDLQATQQQGEAEQQLQSSEAEPVAQAVSDVRAGQGSAVPPEVSAAAQEDMTASAPAKDSPGAVQEQGTQEESSESKEP